MGNQFVPIPIANDQKLEAIQLLATAGRYALPGRWPDFQLERDLEARFQTVTKISFADAKSWLTSVGIAVQVFYDAVSAAVSGDAEPLHTALQTANDNQILCLLEVGDASKLIELLDDSGTTRALWSRSEPCLLVRAGYSTEEGFGWYYASLPGDSRRLCRLTWPSVIAASVTNAVGVLPPAKPLDQEQLQASLHILEQALAAANQAHANVKALLAPGQPTQRSVV